MNSTIAMRISVLMTTVVGASLAGCQAPAQQNVAAQILPAQALEGWACTIDLNAAGIKVPPGVTDSKFVTTRTSRQCPGNTSTGMSIECTIAEPVPGWSGGDQSVQNFECQMFRPVCGLPPPVFVTTFDSEMSCDAEGICTMKCSFSAD
jgi:hypothetical protein